jgi:hypothetical protein
VLKHWLSKPRTAASPSQSPWEQLPSAPDTQWRWFWNSEKGIADGYWTAGPPAEPPDLRAPSLHSAFQQEQDERSGGWLMRGRRRGSWWARR